MAPTFRHIRDKYIYIYIYSVVGLGSGYVVAETVGDRERVLGELCQGLQRHPGGVIIIIISVLFITLTFTFQNGLTKPNSQMYCCHGRVALSRAYDYYQRNHA